MRYARRAPSLYLLASEARDAPLHTFPPEVAILVRNASCRLILPSALYTPLHTRNGVLNRADALTPRQVAQSDAIEEGESMTSGLKESGLL